MGKIIQWAVEPKLEIQFQLRDDFLGTWEDDYAIARLKHELAEILRKERLGGESYAFTGSGKTSLFFKGEISAAAMYGAIKPSLHNWRVLPYVAILHVGERIPRMSSFDVVPFVASPASGIIHVRLSDRDMGTPQDDAFLFPLFEEIHDAFEQRRDVWCDGNGFGGGWCDIFFYGDDEESIMNAVEPFLWRFGAREVVCEIAPMVTAFEGVA
jgi:hypothetical protein